MRSGRCARPTLHWCEKTRRSGSTACEGVQCAAVSYLVRSRYGWRMLPHDLPPWPAVHQQTLRWIKAGCFEALAQDLREVLRVLDIARRNQQRARVSGRQYRAPRLTVIHLSVQDIDQFVKRIRPFRHAKILCVRAFGEKHAVSGKRDGEWPRYFHGNERTLPELPIHASLMRQDTHTRPWYDFHRRITPWLSPLLLRTFRPLVPR